jgi:Arc/MetJ-type ribon-helix-helix transcriptional regulator
MSDKSKTVSFRLTPDKFEEMRESVEEVYESSSEWGRDSVEALISDPHTYKSVLDALRDDKPLIVNEDAITIIEKGKTQEGDFEIDLDFKEENVDSYAEDLLLALNEINRYGKEGDLSSAVEVRDAFYDAHGYEDSDLLQDTINLYEVTSQALAYPI